MRLHVIEKDARFSCGSCGACCNQPWRTSIEADKASALDRHDFSKYTQLAGKRFYHAAADGRAGFFDLAKGEGTKCLFLDTDGLCIIHKELGAEAKPGMCRQFPLISSRTWVDERVSLNFACPSVQRGTGELLTNQAQDVAAVVPLSGRPVQADERVPLNARVTISLAENDALLGSIERLFEPGTDGDIWSRLSQSLDFVEQAIVKQGGAAVDLVVDSTAPIESLANPATAPLGTRMLFAATLQPDTMPADLTGRLGFLGRLTLIPKLMTLANFSGTYPSRVLGRNVTIQDGLAHPVAPDLDDESTALLCRYLHSRVWQRALMGTRLSILAGLHQHIHDVNAVLFFARAEAAEENSPALDAGHIRRGLGFVEFHLANQARVYDQTLKGWLRGQLNDVQVARQSLRLMRLPAATLARHH
ncbi:MAG: YkgJ family cysteine cluster protein [Planctomycetes bacterium]|nr:YkgJ family cysteine cluster protein [Planctomycetota bacterium]